MTMKKLFSLLTTLVMAVGICGVLPASAKNIVIRDLPKYPENGQQCWIIFNEGYRNNRTELSTCNITSSMKNAYIVWDRSLILQGTASFGDYNQYCLSDNNWEQIGTYFKFSDFASQVIASNLDVYDSDGNLLLKRTKNYYSLNKERPKNLSRVQSLKLIKISEATAKITWQKTGGAKGYQVKWAANKKFKKAKKKFTKKNSIILKKLKKRKYYIKVRAYKTVNGKKVYGKWSKVKVIRR